MNQPQIDGIHQQSSDKGEKESSSTEVQGQSLPNSDPSKSYPEPNENDRVVITPQLQDSLQARNLLDPKQLTIEQTDYSGVQRLCTIALAAAAVSMFVGGVPLSVVALVLGIISYRKIQLYCKDSQSVMKDKWEQSLRLVWIAIALSCVGIVLNAISTYYLYSFLNAGGYIDLLTGGPGQTLSGNISVWG